LSLKRKALFGKTHASVPAEGGGMSFIRERRACGTGDAAKSSSSSALKTTHGMNPRISTSVSSIKK
jgi:hypothetical protein